MRRKLVKAYKAQERKREEERRILEEEMRRQEEEHRRRKKRRKREKLYGKEDVPQKEDGRPTEKEEFM